MSAGLQKDDWFPFLAITIQSDFDPFCIHLLATFLWVAACVFILIGQFSRSLNRTHGISNVMLSGFASLTVLGKGPFFKYCSMNGEAVTFQIGPKISLFGFWGEKQNYLHRYNTAEEQSGLFWPGAPPNLEPMLFCGFSKASHGNQQYPFQIIMCRCTWLLALLFLLKFLFYNQVRHM